MYKTKEVKVSSSMRQRMHQCVDIALAPILPEKVNRLEEKLLFHPVVSIGHVHNILEAFLDRAEYESIFVDERCLSEYYKSKEYYVNIPDAPGLHPTYLLATFVTLMCLNHKKIWLECFLSRPDEEKHYLGNSVTGRLLKQFIEEFSELQLVFFERPYNQKEGITFINEHPGITQVIELGDGISVLWKKKYYKNNVEVLYPSTVLVWMQYSPPGRMVEDDVLKQFGRYCSQECYYYRCGYDSRMKAVGCNPGKVGLAGHSYKNLEQFVDDWKDALDADIPLIVFHHKEFNRKWIDKKLKGTGFSYRNGADYHPNHFYFYYFRLWY